MSRMRTGEEERAAGMGHQDRRARMVVVGVQLLDGHRRRFPLVEHFAHAIVKRPDAGCHVGSGASFGGRITPASRTLGPASRLRARRSR